VTLDWPTVALVAVVLVAVVLGLKVTLPYAVGVSSEKARAAALENVNKRLAALEANVGERRNMPGRMR